MLTPENAAPTGVVTQVLTSIVALAEALVCARAGTSGSSAAGTKLNHRWKVVIAFVSSSLKNQWLG